MNPVHRIGRYQLPLFNVVSIAQRAGVRAFLISLWRWGRMLIRNLRYEISLTELKAALRVWPCPGYSVLLVSGREIYFTVEEKTLYDQALEEHAIIMRVYGMAKSAGLRA